MKAKRWLTLAVVALVLIVLAYLQFRTWSSWDWGTFWRQTQSTNKLYLLVALLVIFSDYYFRALRWRILLKPTKDVPSRSLLASQVIGFSAIGVLGRPGDLVRPYLVAKREGLRLSSQVAVLAVERAFDIGAFAILLVAVSFSARFDISPEALQKIRIGALFILAFVAALATGMFAVWRYDHQISEWLERTLGQRYPDAIRSIRQKLQHFSEGLHTIHSPLTFVQLIILSLWIWLMIAAAYWFITQSYQDPSLHGMPPARVFLVMAGSVAGSTLQLPMVGGGSQLGTISVLNGLFSVPNEVATSCGIMLWLITFMSIVPIGLIWARFEHLNLRQVSAESEAAEAAEV